jgi:hypothetical protein
MCCCSCFCLCPCRLNCLQPAQPGHNRSEPGHNRSVCTACLTYVSKRLLASLARPHSHACPPVLRKGPFFWSRLCLYKE